MRLRALLGRAGSWLFSRNLGASVRALQYILRDPSDFILILVGSHSWVGAAQLPAEISLCGGSPGSGQGKGEPPGGARQHLSQAEPRSEPRVTCLVSAAPWSPSWLWGSPARLSVCSCLDGTFHTICPSETVLCFWAHGWTSRTCLPGLAVEMQG